MWVERYTKTQSGTKSKEYNLLAKEDMVMYTTIQSLTGLAVILVVFATIVIASVVKDKRTR